MKKRLNTVFFSLCFLAALIAEAYCIIALEGELISVIGIGIVVLITGYLLLDTIRGQWKQSSEKVKFYLEQVYREESEKWNERYSELLNLEKASYAAAKKRDLRMDEKYEELLLRLNTLENNTTAAMNKITELQKKLMEGQKNALNLEVNYNKENTKLLVNALREEISKLNREEQLSQILSVLQQGGTEYRRNGIEEKEFSEMKLGDAFITEPEEVITNSFAEDTLMEMPLTEEGADYDAEMPQETADSGIAPLYDDPNKALTPEEIASLFASFGK